MVKWPWVSRKKYDELCADYTDMTQKALDAIYDKNALRADLSKLKQPRDKQGRFVRKG